MHSKVILHGLRCWEESMTCNVSQEIMKGTHQVVFAEFSFPISQLLFVAENESYYGAYVGNKRKSFVLC